MATQSLEEAWPSDVSEAEATPEEIEDAAEHLLLKIGQLSGQMLRKTDLLYRAMDEAEERAREDNAMNDVFSIAYSDHCEAGRVMQEILLRGLTKFVESNLDEVQRAYNMGKYSEVDE